MIQLQYQQQKQQQQQQQQHQHASRPTRPPRFSPTSKSKPTVGDLKDLMMLQFPDVADPDVGHGTLLFPSERNLQRLRSTSFSDAGSSIAQSKEPTDPPPMTQYGSTDPRSNDSSFPPHMDDEETDLYDDHGYTVDPYAENSRFLMPPSEYHGGFWQTLGQWTVYPIASCCGEIWTSEALHRSLCFGAIDGMLTGSGIVATFCGMGLLEWRGSEVGFVLRTVVVVFCAAACFADSVCMALGHIWTTHVLVTTQARERTDMRSMIENAQADVKGQLVDMLLSKGMLKIDAMSLANTLEGYPDLFLAAVMGESLASAHVEIPPPADSEYDVLMNRSGVRQPPSQLYGRLQEYDPDAAAVASANHESRKESFFMMLGFSSFAVLPSLLFQWIPLLLNSKGDKSTSVHPETMIVSIMAVTMWLLGIWKSRFLDSNWLVFGVEAVLVLLVCIAAAYLVGFGLRRAFLPEVRVEIVQKSTLHYNGGSD